MLNGHYRIFENKYGQTFFRKGKKMKMESKQLSAVLILALGLLVGIQAIAPAASMGTAFTFQGRFTDANSPANGEYDFEWKLFDDPNSGTQLGSTIYSDNLDVNDGDFTAVLDFGSGIFDGNACWLEIGARPGDSNDTYTTLDPRRELTPAGISGDTIHIGDIWGRISGQDIWGHHTYFFIAILAMRYYYEVMARLARVVVPGVPHHITQRGNRRQATFFNEADYTAYLELTAEWCGRFGVVVWAYCLMPNHVHLIVVPESEDGLRRGIGEAHRRYSRRINFREGWRGHLWQGRFASFPMDERYLMLAVRYVELNPVRAKLCRAPWRWRWSSAAAHVAGRNDSLVDVSPLLERVDDWRAYLASGLSNEEANLLRGHERTGRPLGSLSFLKRIESKLGRVIRKKTPGRKPKNKKK